MALNKVYLTCDRSEKGDERYTPFYAVMPILEYIPNGSTIWCPFDEEWSAYVQILKEKGYKVINTNLKKGKDFFKYEPDNWDIIISNPPFSKKDDVLQRCYDLGKPFALLLPIQTLQGKKRFENFYYNGLELLTFDQRIGFHTNNDFEKTNEGVHFASAYFCKDLLPEKLIFKRLYKYERKLKSNKQTTIFDYLED